MATLLHINGQLYIYTTTHPPLTDFEVTFSLPLFSATKFFWVHMTVISAETCVLKYLSSKTSFLSLEDHERSGVPSISPYILPLTTLFIFICNLFLRLAYFIFNSFLSSSVPHFTWFSVSCLPFHLHHPLLFIWKSLPLRD